MAITKQAQIDALTAANAALTARLEAAIIAYRALRDGTAQVAPRIERPVAVPQVTQWRDQSGQLWETTRLGNQKRSHKVAEEQPA